jgi:RimJ/RimL family protein N-acetyltransferase
MQHNFKIGNKVNFKKSKLPSKKKLIGRYCQLEPINIKKHSNDLFKNFSLNKDNFDWVYMPLGPFKSLFLFKKYLKNFCLNKDPFFYAIYSKKLKKYSGLASYLRIKPEIGTIEVGWITYAPNLQKTVEATEAMYLMMRNIFDVLGYRRYEWKCDNLNKRSKKSAVRLGFKYEGLFRQATIYKRRNRDTAWFAIIDKEWKKLKYGFQRYLKLSNFDKDYTQLKKLKLKFK